MSGTPGLIGDRLLYALGAAFGEPRLSGETRLWVVRRPGRSSIHIHCAPDHRTETARISVLDPTASVGDTALDIVVRTDGDIAELIEDLLRGVS